MSILMKIKSSGETVEFVEFSDYGRVLCKKNKHGLVSIRRQDLVIVVGSTFTMINEFHEKGVFCLFIGMRAYFGIFNMGCDFKC